MTEQELLTLKDRVGYSGKPQQFKYGFDLAIREMQAAQQKEGYLLVPQSLLNRIVEICEEQANEWDSDAVVTHKNYAQCCGVLIRSLIKAAQEPT